MSCAKCAVSCSAAFVVASFVCFAHNEHAIAGVDPTFKGGSEGLRMRIGMGKVMRQCLQ